MSIPGSAKYSSTGNCNPQLFRRMNLPDEVKISLAELGNFGVAKSTWSTYKSAERLLLKCQAECKTKFDWPLRTENVLLFIHWLVTIRGVKGGTVSSYLSGIRQLHILDGIDPPNLRPEVVKLILKGIEHKDNASSRGGAGDNRIPMTRDLMKILKGKVIDWEQDWDMKLLVWAVCTLAFHGAFRIHELLCQTESFFDPQYTLLTENLTRSTDSSGKGILHIKLNCPKEQRNGKAVIVDVFESSDSICPVKAFGKWATRQPPTIGMPLFRQPDGTEEAKARKGKIKMHSFRIGIASELGTEGLEDGEIKAAGRWSSRAFESYMRTPRTKRASIAKKIAELGNKKGIARTRRF